MSHFTNANGKAESCTTAGIISSLESAIKLVRSARAVYTQNHRYSDADTDKEYMLRAASTTLEGTAASLRSIADALTSASERIAGEAAAAQERRQQLQRRQQHVAKRATSDSNKESDSSVNGMLSEQQQQTTARYALMSREQDSEATDLIGLYKRQRDAMREAQRRVKEGHDCTHIIYDRKARQQVGSWQGTEILTRFAQGLNSDYLRPSTI